MRQDGGKLLLLQLWRAAGRTDGPGLAGGCVLCTHCAEHPFVDAQCLALVEHLQDHVRRDHTFARRCAVGIELSDLRLVALERGRLLGEAEEAHERVDIVGVLLLVEED
eukprot:93513-Rhodomonas_salina.1